MPALFFSPDGLKPLPKKNDPPVCSAVSLFAGCGGSDLGLRSAGAEVIWANEKNESAAGFYEAITGGNHIEVCDVARVDKFKKADILAGCYPCQGYSQGGVREAEAGINFLYRQFDRALRQIRPSAFIVENVDGMRFGRNYQLLKNQLVRFRLAGYRASWKVLDAKDYGLAQTRKRLFIVGIRSRLSADFDFPAPTHGPNGVVPYRTQRNVIWHLRNKTNGTYNQEPMHWYYLSRDRRQDWNEPAGTVVARDRHVALHPDSPKLHKVGTDAWEFVRSPEKARRLSYLECAALQGFPDPYKFGKQSLPMRYRSIGNAVPPPLFEQVARAVFIALKWL